MYLYKFSRRVRYSFRIIYKNTCDSLTMFVFLSILGFAAVFPEWNFAQSSSIVFSNKNSNGDSTTNARQISCRCVASGTCTPKPNTGIDIRIVNQGNNCASGQMWCCGESGSLIDGTCGIRKITDSPAQPVGTAKYGSYPWHAAILTQDNVFVGSGVLINEDYVLTAAHKVFPYPNLNFKIRLGEWDGQHTTEPNAYQEYAPVQVTIHPSYGQTNLHNDLAVVRLDRSVPISTSPNINAACLATAVPKEGTKCWVPGWGKNAFGPTGNYQSMLKEVDVPIVGQADCERRLRTTRLGQFFNLDRTSFMCAGGEAGKDACTGDGGSALVCEGTTGQFQVVGLVSWGIGCATTGIPGVYVNVPNYRTWINQQIGVSP